MQNLRIYGRRIEQFVSRVMETRYSETVPMKVEYIYDSRQPIPIEKLKTAKWKPIQPGTRWGELWGSAWFKVTGKVPAAFKGKEVVALIDTGSESCIFADGSPAQGLTDWRRTPGDPSGKRRVHVTARAKGGESLSYLLEAGANSLFGYHGKHEFAFERADIAVFHRERWQLGMDLEYLQDLAKSLPQESPRAKKLWRGLNDAANAWNDGAGLGEAQKICAGLFARRADASAPTVWSIGHAHLDLGWLWPVSESRRKAGRTFSTALMLIKEYPDYVFGASQPQAYQWVKEDYPDLYKRMKKAIKDGRWECQGGMWVEPDMNVPSGESLVRQLVYGKGFYRSEFGIDVNNLWLPDVFGYSAALPQLLRLAGVDYFMTQKISWNETNRFPHHSFIWEGIDGTGIPTHFLPMDDYNSQVLPSQLIKGEAAFAQADVADDWLNLYGIGDGGGGPSRKHIEYVRRGSNTEGVPRTRMAASTEFFSRFGRIPEDRLPKWRGELYLELHRGTYTTQARLKKYNRQLELGLRNAEYFSTLSGLEQREQLSAVWRDMLLHQFHDILPGSSITRVYDDAHAISEKHLKTLEKLTSASLATLNGSKPRSPKSFVVHNTLSWQRQATVLIPGVTANQAFVDPEGRALPAQAVDGGVVVQATIPSMGYTTVTGLAGTSDQAKTARDRKAVKAGSRGSSLVLENSLLKVTIRNDGTIGTILDKENSREALSGPANRLMLWEDLPYSWDAWDVSHYYRETTPEQAQLINQQIVESGPVRCVVEQTLSVGVSSITQRIVLDRDSRLVQIENQVDWKEKSKQLRVQAEPAVVSDHATYEIQFGAVTRPTHANTSWDQAMFEVAGQRFADYAQADYGVGMVNNCKYGHYIRDGVMDLNLLRSPSDPDPVADRGEHTFTYGYYPHAGTWESSALLEVAHELNVAPHLWPVSEVPAEPVASFFALEGSGVEIDTVKPAEQGRAVVLRLYETRGGSARIRLLSRKKWLTIQEVNLLEEKGKDVPRASGAGPDGFDSAASMTFGPYQIRSFRISFA